MLNPAQQRSSFRDAACRLASFSSLPIWPASFETALSSSLPIPCEESTEITKQRGPKLELLGEEAVEVEVVDFREERRTVLQALETHPEGRVRHFIGEIV